MSLYRKYRPQDFPSLVGQDHVRTTLLNAVKAEQIAHAYLFTGPRGTGKTTTARLLAKCVNSDAMSDDGRFDGCEIAEEIEAGKLIDVLEIDAASNRGIDEIRDLREKINFSPTRAKNKVYIIDEVHMLTKEAFNALLKTLEEPPNFVYFVLATTEVHKVPETIISRCQRFDFKRVTEEAMLARLAFVCSEEGIKAEEAALKLIAKQARGSMRDVLTFLEQLTVQKELSLEQVQSVLGLSQQDAVEKLYNLILAGQNVEAVALIGESYQQGVDLNHLGREFLEYLRSRMLVAVEAGQNLELQRILAMIEYFQAAQEKQKFSAIAELPLEIATVKACLLSESRTQGNIKEAQVVMDSKVEVKEREIEARLDVSKPEVMIEKNQVTLDIKLKDFVDKWEAVAKRIHNPVVRRTFSAADPEDLKDNRLTIVFADNFSKEKLFENQNVYVAESAIEAEFGVAVKLVGKVDTSRNVLAKDDSKPSTTEKSPLSQALNVFGEDLT